MTMRVLQTSLMTILVQSLPMIDYQSEPVPIFDGGPNDRLADIFFTKDDVFKLLRDLKPCKASRPDKINPLFKMAVLKMLPYIDYVEQSAVICCGMQLPEHF